MGLINAILNRTVKKACPKCKTSFFGAAYTYRQGPTDKDNGDVAINFQVKCPKCGHIYKFTHFFGTSGSTPLESKIQDFCDKMFGSALERQ